MINLHPLLKADSEAVAMLKLCEVRLMTDANFPWLVLIPQREDVREIHALMEDDQQTLMREVAFVSKQLEALTGAQKMNVAALGNMVPQLHIHIIARFEGDAAWPGPIWGVAPPKAYSASAREKLVAQLKKALIS